MLSLYIILIAASGSELPFVSASVSIEQMLSVSKSFVETKIDEGLQSKFLTNLDASTVTKFKGFYYRKRWNNIRAIESLWQILQLHECSRVWIKDPSTFPIQYEFDNFDSDPTSYITYLARLLDDYQSFLIDREQVLKFLNNASSASPEPKARDKNGRVYYYLPSSLFAEVFPSGKLSDSTTSFFPTKLYFDILDETHVLTQTEKEHYIRAFWRINQKNDFRADRAIVEKVKNLSVEDIYTLIVYGEPSYAIESLATIHLKNKTLNANEEAWMISQTENQLNFILEKYKRGEKIADIEIQKWIDVYLAIKRKDLVTNFLLRLFRELNCDDLKLVLTAGPKEWWTFLASHAFDEAKNILYSNASWLEYVTYWAVNGISWYKECSKYFIEIPSASLSQVENFVILAIESKAYQKYPFVSDFPWQSFSKEFRSIIYAKLTDILARLGDVESMNWPRANLVVTLWQVDLKQNTDIYLEMVRKQWRDSPLDFHYKELKEFMGR